MKHATSNPYRTCSKRKFSNYFIALNIAFSLIICVAGYGQAYEHPPSGLFDSEDVLDIRLVGNIREVLNDRSDDMQYHPLRLIHHVNDSVVSIPIKVKTRGHFRRTMGNCIYPPLLLNFQKKEIPENSIFFGQDKIKLVTPCRDERYVVHEYLVYKLYNLITEKSFKARLVRVVYEDTVKEKKSESLFGILLEHEDQMAQRNKANLVTDKLILPEQTHRDEFLKMAVFEYLIGNTDWSVKYKQNIKLITDTLGLVYPVPYDFDHAGIVQAPYAQPAPELKLTSTRERRYRGYCVQDIAVFENAFASFNQLKDDFYDVYQRCPWLSYSYKKSTLRYFDEFYKTINDPKSALSAFTYPCDEQGTGNVVIKGLK